jgi:hypothetical protein
MVFFGENSRKNPLEILAFRHKQLIGGRPVSSAGILRSTDPTRHRPSGHETCDALRRRARLPPWLRHR